MTRLALVLSGGISQGAYTAGALSELLLALEENRSDRSVRLAVVTGDGAGALCAALAARATVVNPKLLPWIWRTWSEALDLRKLVDAGRPNRAGLLDSRAVDALTGPLVAGPPAVDDRPGAALGGSLRLGVALTDVDGSARVLPRDGAGDGRREPLSWRAHEDAVEFDLSPGRSPAGDPVWEELRRAAVAASFPPLLVPPRRVVRSGETEGEDGGDGPGTRVSWGLGGVGFERPFRLAARLSQRAVDHREADWRFVVVNPHCRRMNGGDEERSGRDFPTGGDSRSRPESAALVLKWLAGALSGAGGVEDLRRATDVNRRRDLLEALVGRLPEIHGRLDDAEAVGLGRLIGQLAERAAERETAAEPDPGRSGAPDPVLERLDSHLSRIESDPVYSAAFQGLASRAGRTRLAKLIYVLESMADLAGKRSYPVHVVAPPAGREMAGSSHGGLGGLLDPERRLHDLRGGRADARRLLEEELSDLVTYEAARPPESYRPEEVRYSRDTLPPESRRALREYLEEEARRTLSGLEPGGVGGLLFRLGRSSGARALAERWLEELERT